MPELPEVESTVRFMRERITGTTVQCVEILWERTIAKIPVHLFIKQLTGAYIADVTRRGKFVVVTFQKSSVTSFLFVHLRMSGQFDIVRSDLPIEKHDRAAFELSNGKSLRFNDVRKFGKMYLVSSMEDISNSLGIEPLSEAFTADWLYENLQSSTRAIKTHLLDQSFIAGIGNIYADESLFRAKIHPLTPSKKITANSASNLNVAIRTVLQEAIEKSGTDFGDGVVYGGMFSPQVYGRTKLPCVDCETIISRIVVGQRSTHFCKNCQKRRVSKQSRPKGSK